MTFIHLLKLDSVARGFTKKIWDAVEGFWQIIRGIIWIYSETITKYKSHLLKRTVQSIVHLSTFFQVYYPINTCVNVLKNPCPEHLIQKKITHLFSMVKIWWSDVKDKRSIPWLFCFKRALKAKNNEMERTLKLQRKKLFFVLEHSKTHYVLKYSLLCQAYLHINFKIHSYIHLQSHEKLSQKKLSWWYWIYPRLNLRRRH